ncbi:MAG TPA: Sua5/YciO/YrdC/YwlC family protein, partial [Candidatus Hydrogenedentes bacterium]|nr:Sua5/YciO/YrdC/YwlC family protein [Candidatus Hydrogenedentota bacterium]
MIIAKPDRDGIAVAARAIRDGKVVAYPTETVYGLAVDPFSREAIRALFEAKGRPEVNPVLLIAADVSQVEKISLAISDTARRY